MKQLFVRLHALLCISLFAFMACSPPIAGTGTETQNPRIAGIVYALDGSPAPGVAVYLLHADADPLHPDTVAWAATDSLGGYVFDCEPGAYAVSATDTRSLYAAVQFDSCRSSGTTLWPDLSIAPRGSISVDLSAYAAGQPCTRSVIGSTVAPFACQTGDTVVVPAVPSGTYPILGLHTATVNPAYVRTLPYTVVPGETTTVRIRPVVFVVTDDTTGFSDLSDPMVMLRSALADSGLAPKTTRVVDFTPACIAEASLIIVSGTATPDSAACAAMQTSTVPIMSCNPVLYSVLHMTGDTVNTHWGLVQKVTLSFPAAHPVLGEYPGSFPAFLAASDTGYGGFGLVSPAATVVASDSASPGHALIFGYEPGSTMVNMTATGRRVGFFQGSMRLNALGKILAFRTAVWTLRG